MFARAGLTREEVQQLLAEAKRHSEAFDAQNRELQATLEPLIAAREWERMRHEQDRIRLAYREQVIAARDRILGRLADRPQVRDRLSEAMARLRPGMSASVSEEDYMTGFFWLPQ